MRYLLPLCLCWGCAPDPLPEVGDLTVAWQVGPDGCDAGGVTDVVVTVDDARLALLPCDDGAGTIEGVAAGERRVQLFAVDGSGVERFAAEPITVVIAANEERRVPQVRLSALPARAAVQWYFDNGRLCAANGVSTVEVNVWQDGFLAASIESGCEAGQAVVTSLPGGDYLAEVLGHDSAGGLRAAGETPLVLERGDNVVVEIALSADE